MILLIYLNMRRTLRGSMIEGVARSSNLSIAFNFLDFYQHRTRFALWQFRVTFLYIFCRFSFAFLCLFAASNFNDFLVIVLLNSGPYMEPTWHPNGAKMYQKSLQKTNQFVFYLSDTVWIPSAPLPGPRLALLGSFLKYFRTNFERLSVWLFGVVSHELQRLLQHIYLLNPLNVLDIHIFTYIYIYIYIYLFIYTYLGKMHFCLNMLIYTENYIESHKALKKNNIL